MRIGVISNQRTRGSYFLDILAQAHSLNNYSEWLVNNQLAFTKLKISTSRLNFDFPWERYKKNLRQMISDHLSEDNFIEKIFPSILLNLRSQQILHTPEDRNSHYFKESNIITDFDVLSLEKYDQIYFIERNIIDACMSYSYACISNNWLFFDRDKPKKNVYRGLVKPNLQDYFLIDMHLISLLMMPYLENYLKSKSFKYVKLNFDDIPIFLKEKYPNFNSILVDSEYDYKELIDNYSELEDYFHARIPSIEEKLNELYSKYKE